MECVDFEQAKHTEPRNLPASTLSPNSYLNPPASCATTSSQKSITKNLHLATSLSTHLCWEGVAVNRMLRAHLVLQSVVYMYLVELVLVAQGPSRYVDMISGRVFNCEYNAVPRISYNAINLQQKPV